METYISSRDMILSVEQSLERLHALRYQPLYRNAVGEDLIAQAEKWEQMIRAQRDEPVTVSVIGEFNRGKSTLINALLGEEVVTTDVTTETVTLNTIRYGVESTEALLSGNRRMRMTAADMKRERLEDIQDEIGESVRSLELQRPCEWLKQATIIDTPGMDDALRDFAPEVERCLIRSDVVVYVFNAMYPLSISEQLFLRASVLPLKGTKLILVANQMDRAGNEANYLRMKQLIEDRVNALLPDAKVLLVSALDERCRQCGSESPAPSLETILRAQFDELRTVVAQTLTEKQQTVLPDRMQRLVTVMCSELEGRLHALKNGAELSREAALTQHDAMLREQQQSVEQQQQYLNSMHTRVQDMHTEAMSWMTNFIDSMVKEAEKLNDYPQETVRRYFESYCIDMLQNAMNACLEHHQNRLYDELDAYSDTLSQQLSQSLVSQKLAPFRMNLDTRVWTNSDTAGSVITYMNGKGYLDGISTIAASAIAGFFRKTEQKAHQEDFVKNIRSKLNQLYETTLSALAKRYEEIDRNINRIIGDYFAEQLVSVKQNAELLLRSAVQDREAKEGILTMADEALNILDDLKQMVACNIKA